MKRSLQVAAYVAAGLMVSGADELQNAFSKLADEKGSLNEEELETLIFRPHAVNAQAEARNRHMHVDFRSDDNGKRPSGVPISSRDRVLGNSVVGRCLMD